MKNLLLVIIGVLGCLANEAYSQVAMEKDGNWNVGNNWVSKTAAGVGQDVVLNINIDGTVISTDDITVKSITMNNGSTITIEAGGKLTIDNTGVDALTTINKTTITVNGELTINGNLVVNNNLTLRVKGDLMINGDVILKNNADLTFDSGSNTTISGSFSAGSNSTLQIDAPLAIGGDFTTGAGGTIAGGTSNLSVAGTCSGSMCSSGVLPIELLAFEAKANGDDVEILWSTASEEDFDYFTIERSGDGTEFSAIAEIEGNGNSTRRIDYTYFDNQPIIGTSYYRLKATDLDGTVEIFDVVGINFVGTFNSKIYPNPAISNEITVQINDLKENVKVTVHSSGGDLVFADELNTLTSKVSLPENVENGIYIVTFLNSTTSQKHRLVLNR